MLKCIAKDADREEKKEELNGYDFSKVANYLKDNFGGENTELSKELPFTIGAIGLTLNNL